MVDTININDLYVAGRTNAPDPNTNRVAVARNLDMSVVSSYLLDFTTVNQQGVFGLIRTMFMDNSQNPNEVVILVSNTQQTFTIPAFAEGYFNITAADTSKIQIDSLGGATGVVSTVFYNYEISPSVWYKYGLDPNAGILKVEGTIDEGADIATSANNNPVYIGVKNSAGDLDGLTEGQAAMAASLPVVVASDQSAFPVTVAGVATEVTLASINAKTRAAGQATMAASSPVVIASNQSAIPTTVAGVATEATLAAINTKTLAAGQQTMAASSPVVIASNQSSISVSVGSALPAGTNIIGAVIPTPSTSVGGFGARVSIVSAAGTNATLVSAGARPIGNIIASNLTAVVKFIKIFNKATAPVTGTDTPVMNFSIPANSTITIPNACGSRVSLGLGFAITNGAALLVNTGVAANDVLLNIEYV